MGTLFILAVFPSTLLASACRTSSEHDDKTNLMELGDESTGVVRDELRKVAEELLPSQTKSELDIYGIKATLHGERSSYV